MRLNPDKLYVEYRDGVTYTEPILGRRYTLTHSDSTADLFLTIGNQYAFDKINLLRDEVLAEWRMDISPFLFVCLYIDGQSDPATSAIRNRIFRRELPLALEAMRYGDSSLYVAYPDLDNACICVYFDSMDPEYRRLEQWGYMRDWNTVLF